MAAVMTATGRPRPAGALAALALLALCAALAPTDAPASSLFGDPLPAAEAAPLVAVAQTAAAALGIAFGPDAVATEYIAPGGRPAWWVRCGYRTRSNQAYNSFWLARGSGALLLAENFDAWDRGPAGPFLSEAEAIARATAALEAVGMPADVALEGAELTCRGGPPNCQPECTCGGRAEWRVTWNRVYQGFPHERAADVVVELNARTGEVASLRLFSTPPAPARTVVALSGTRAMAIALAHVAALLGRPVPQPVTTARLEIAQPYLAWSDPDRGREARYDDPTRLVWRVEVSTRANEEYLAYGLDPTQSVGYVQVDAATGAVVGDQRTSSLLWFLRSRPPHEAGRAALRSLLLAAAIILPLLVAGGLFARFLLLSRPQPSA